MMPMLRRGQFVAAIGIAAVVAAISYYTAADVRQRGARAGQSVTDQPADDTLIAGIRVSLAQKGQACRITSRNDVATAVDLQISWPCAFHRGRDGAVRVLVDGNDSIFLVESSRPDPANPSRCITQVQAMRVQGRTLRPSEHHDVVTICLPFQWDEVMFRGLFANP
jgi:hypothetical protein